MTNSSPKEIEHGPLYHSTGVLKYDIINGSYKSILEIDRNIGLYYYSMIPKYYNCNHQKYQAHITVVRKEIPANLNVWGKHEGLEFDFCYSAMIHRSIVYFWLNAFSLPLEEIRIELGLPVYAQYTKPPIGFRKCFHISLGNCKGN